MLWAMFRGRLHALVVLVVALACVGTPGVASEAPGGEAETIAVGDGTTLRIDRAPFRLTLLGRDGEPVVGTVPGREGAPVRVPGIDGPQPFEPVGDVGGFPAIGFVAGAQEDVAFPATFWTGNRLFGAEAGALVSLVEVVAVHREGDRVQLEVRTDAPSLGPAAVTVEPLTGGGVRLDVTPPEELTPDATMFTLESPAGEGLFGLGARKDRFDQRGLLRNVWVEQQNSGSGGPFEPLPGGPEGECAGVDLDEDYTFPNGRQAAYYVQGALFGSRGWGAWLGRTELSRLDLAACRPDAVRWGVASPQLTLFLAGGGLERASQAFTAVTGRAPAPPRWVYEPWIDVINEGEGEAAPYGGGFSAGQRVRDDAATIAAKAAELDIPIGVIGMEGWHVVPDIDGFAADLRSQGFHLSAYWSPFVAPEHPKFAEARDGGYLVETETGQPYPLVTNRGNTSYVIDFTDPAAREWWGEQIDTSSDLGFEGFMHDFGEFVKEGMVFESGDPPEVVHNRYPVLQHRAARASVEAFAADNPGFEPFFYVRAGYSTGGDGSAGVVASTPSVFPGDETTDWNEGSGIPSVPPAMLNLALGGSYAFTTDVGGYLDLYTPQTSKELFVRWSQLAAFTAISRIHTSTFNGSVHPWDFDDETVDIYRRYARAKVELIDLVDRWARRASTDGTVGPVRPIVLEDTSPDALAVDDQWLLGTDILVAPVLEEGARERDVYLPVGADWERVVVGEDGRLVATGDIGRGGSTVTAPAPLADIPLFVRRPAGAADDGGGADVPGAPGGGGSTPATGGAGLAAIGLLALLAAAGPRRVRSRTSMSGTDRSGSPAGTH